MDSTAVDVLVPPDMNLEAAFRRYSLDAKAVSTPTPCKADLALVVSNLATALKNIAPRAREAQEALPKVNVAWALEILNVARATQFVSERIIGKVSTGELATRTAEMWDLREPLLLQARVFGLKTMLPKAQVEHIRKGRGPYDAAQDLVQLVALFREHAAVIRGKHPFTEEDFVHMEKVGNWMLANLTPAGANIAANDPHENAVLRDQLWTLVLERDKKLRVMAQVLFEEDADTRVPSLRSRAFATRENAEPENDKKPDA
jgi:hypothetical protein